MSAPSLRALLERPWVRVACGFLGIGVLALVVYASGARAVLQGLGGSLHALPAVAAFELAVLGCRTLALRALYGSDAARVAPRQWVRAGALGYAVGTVLPIGRASAEASRALFLGRTVGGARAAVAAVQMQGVALLANAFFTLFTLAVALKLVGLGTISALLLANTLVTLVLGMGILAVRERARPGRLLGLFTARGREFGRAFDATLGASGRGILASLAWETGARVFQLLQCAVALAAVGRLSGPGKTVLANGLLMLGGAIGDLIPAQLGVTEATLAMGAAAVGLTAATAATVALLIHGAQLALALLCGSLALATPGLTRPASKLLENGP